MSSSGVAKDVAVRRDHLGAGEAKHVTERRAVRRDAHWADHALANLANLAQVALAVEAHIRFAGLTLYSVVVVIFVIVFIVVSIGTKRAEWTCASRMCSALRPTPAHDGANHSDFRGDRIGESEL